MMHGRGTGSRRSGGSALLSGGTLHFSATVCCLRKRSIAHASAAMSAAGTRTGRVTGRAVGITTMHATVGMM
jgi:hypothetical protein